MRAIERERMLDGIAKLNSPGIIDRLSMRAKRPMKHVYLILAIVGAMLPLALLMQHASVAGWSLATLASDVLANPASAAVAADVSLSSIAFWIFMFSRPAAPRPWLYIVLNLAIGLSCALPAYLYADVRSRAL